jgi:hypothetical protein
VGLGRVITRLRGPYRPGLRCKMLSERFRAYFSDFDHRHQLWAPADDRERFGPLQRRKSGRLRHEHVQCHAEGWAGAPRRLRFLFAIGLPAQWRSLVASQHLPNRPMR